MAHDDIARIEGRLVMDSKQDLVDALQKCREALIQIRGFVSVMEANNWRDRATAYRAPVRRSQFDAIKGRPCRSFD